MNAPVRMADSQSIRSLLDHCRDKHWRLLQKFAEAEIHLSQVLAGDVPQTFGAKVNRFGNVSKAQRASLIDARNLVAHGHLSVIDLNGQNMVICRVADARSGLNAVVRSRAEIDCWSKSVTAELDQFLRAIAKA